LLARLAMSVHCRGGGNQDRRLHAARVRRRRRRRDRAVWFPLGETRLAAA
jgi:hypothetical protein